MAKSDESEAKVAMALAVFCMITGVVVWIALAAIGIVTVIKYLR